jgi:hypothetical protein
MSMEVKPARRERVWAGVNFIVGQSITPKYENGWLIESFFSTYSDSKALMQ